MQCVPNKFGLVALALENACCRVWSTSVDASVRGNRQILGGFSLLLIMSASDWQRDCDVTINDDAWSMRHQKKSPKEMN